MNFHIIKRIGAYGLSAALLFSSLPTAAWAAGAPDNLCEHHPEHTAECGYTEGSEGTPCTFVCEICSPQDSGDRTEPEETEPEEIQSEETMPEETASPSNAPLMLAADEQATGGDFGENNSLHWELDEDGTLTITGTGDMPDWTSDNASLQSRPWYNHFINGNITKLVISEGVTSVGDYMFYGRNINDPTIANQSMSCVVLPDSLVSIGASAFHYCEGLTSINLPDNLTSIEMNAFRDCETLLLTELPSKLTSLGNGAFAGCENLALTELPAGIISIPKQLFMKSTFTSSSLTIHAGITAIEDSAFEDAVIDEIIFMSDTPPSIGENAVMLYEGRNFIPAVWNDYIVAPGKWAFIKYWYDVTVQTEGGGTASASQTGIVKQGVDEVTLTATPQEGYHFVGWKAPDGITITDNKFIIPDEYSEKENITITAVFEPHTWSTDWTTDSTSHWHECTLASCGATTEKASHTPAYTASGQAISAACGGCQEALGTATISAAGGVYNGSPHTAAVSGTDTMDRTWDIAYREQDGEALSAAPVDVGSYTASITIGGAAASVDFTISQADGRGTVSLDGWTYGDTPNSPEPVSDANGTDHVTYLYTSTDSGGYSGSTAPANAGSYKVTATFAETRNHKEHTASADFVISQKQAEKLTIEGVEDSYTYTGSAIKPEITVKDGGRTLDADTDYTVTYGANTTVADGGSVTITMKNPNYTGSKTVNFAITKAVPAYTAPDGLTAVYGQTLSDVSLASGTGSGAWSWKDSGASVGNAGTQTHEAVFTPDDTANYQTMTVPLEVKVEKADLELSGGVPTASAVEYGQKLSASTLSGGAVKNKTTGQSVEGAWSWKNDGASVGNAGTQTHEAVFTAYDKDNYNTLTAEGISVQVNAVKPVIVVVPDPASAIEGETISVKVTVTNPHGSTLDAPGATLTYQIGNDTAQPLTGGSFTIPDGTPTGTVITVTATTQAEGNYLAATGTATVIVTDCTHTGTTTMAYDGTAHWQHCSRCGADIGKEAHSGGTATCTEQAECEVCGQPYGPLDPANHVYVPGTDWHYDANDHWGVCACGVQLAREAHHGGTATCKDRAVCSVCGQPYGDKDADNHTGGTEVRGQKEATTAAEGYTGDTYCLGCGEKIASGTVIPKKPSGGGSSGGGSSHSGSPMIIDRPDENHPTTPTTAQTTPVKPGTNGKANINGNTVQQAIDKAVADAKKNGNTANGIAVVVPVNVGDTLKDVQIILKADTLDKLVSSNVKQFTIDTDRMTDFGFTLDTLKELNRQTSGDIILKVKKTAVTSVEAKAAIGNRPVYDISLWEAKNGKETKLTDLNGKTISIAIPYTPAKNEQPGNLYAVYVDGNGKPQWITQSSYDADQKAVIFELTQSGIYGVGYDAKTPAFTDITGHWAKDNILFVVSRGLLNGTSKTTFSPNNGMTRGMFVTALGRLAGVDLADYSTGKFTDVKTDAYYAPYVNWAASKGIVNGTSATTFAPDTNINREQMAVIMKNYAAKLGYTVPKTLEAVTFADNASISSWAKEAVKSMQQAGILAGKTNNRFEPATTATRAEVATVLRRFVEIVIDPQTANGWKQIDGKQCYFYADGSMAVNTTVDGYAVGADGARK